MLKKRFCLYAGFIMFFCFALTCQALAQMPSVAFGLKAGTLGAGGDVVVKITDSINARLGLQGFTYDINDTESGIEYDADIELFSGLLLADWFPFDSHFRISAGVLMNENEVNVTGKPEANQTFDINGTIYTSNQVGKLKGNTDFKTFVPYVGIGWGNPFHRESNWSVSFDIGVAYQGSADMNITATGTLANDPTFRFNLEQERQELEDEADDFKYYPVISIGVTYKF